MKQVFRLMGGPDRIIAFDSLPDRLLEGFELCEAAGFPRHWKEWMGKTKRFIKIPPEKDFLTGQVRRFEPIVEEDSYFYLVDWNLRPVAERWDNICDFVKRVVPKEFRLKENIGAMALPLAANTSDGVTLEPEDVVIIPIPLEYQEKSDKIVEPIAGEKNVLRGNDDPQIVKCQEAGCTSEFEGKHAKNALRMHAMKKHPKVKASA